jgi:fermentation-respiration switch protein FrsA (DUF1100 family)
MDPGRRNERGQLLDKLQAAFSGYRAMGSTVVGRHVWTWPLYVMMPFLGRRYDAIRYVAKISPRPVLFIHGDRDTIVPIEMSRKLYAAAREPKSLWIIEGAGHLQCRAKAGATYETRVGDFFTEALQRTAVGGL